MRYHYISLKGFCGDFRVTVPGTSIGSSSAPAEYMDRMRYHYISLKVFCGDFRVTVPGTSIGSSSAPAEYMDRMRYHYISLKVFCGDFRMSFSRKQHWLPVPLANIGGSAGRGGLSNPSKTIIIYIYIYAFLFKHNCLCRPAMRPSSNSSALRSYTITKESSPDSRYLQW